MASKSLVRQEKRLPSKQKRHVRRYKSGAKAVINPDNVVKKRVLQPSRVSSQARPRSISKDLIRSKPKKILAPAPKTRWTDILKKDLGKIVPVEEEESAEVKLPSNVFVAKKVLDIRFTPGSVMGEIEYIDQRGNQRYVISEFRMSNASDIRWLEEQIELGNPVMFFYPDWDPQRTYVEGWGPAPGTEDFKMMLAERQSDAEYDPEQSSLQEFIKNAKKSTRKNRETSAR